MRYMSFLTDCFSDHGDVPLLAICRSLAIFGQAGNDAIAVCSRLLSGSHALCKLWCTCYQPLTPVPTSQLGSTIIFPRFVHIFLRVCLPQELNYEKSVTNEIACLRILSHPGIARLISAFRWRDGAYLVLEYASRGDLHGHVKQHGSLSEASTRLVSSTRPFTKQDRSYRAFVLE